MSKNQIMITKYDIQIDRKFSALIPPLRPEEREQLKLSLIAEGCRDALVVWDHNGSSILLDGHNRFSICQENDIPFEVRSLDFSDREAAADWIDANQLGRRNLTPDQYSLLRGRRYNRTKRQGERTDLTCGKNFHKSKTAEKLASQHGVDERTIRNDGKFAAAVETVKTVDPKIEAKVVQGKAPARGLIIEAA